MFWFQDLLYHHNNQECGIGIRTDIESRKEYSPEVDPSYKIINYGEQFLFLIPFFFCNNTGLQHWQLYISTSVCPMAYSPPKI